ncbi:hypothetical protein NDU88_006910 [Pleurodeles waltl]|uniref:Uncharacterized protein n=1 Tax=Pleurodeles waltl TaxID=8319 RepID=A0AAV7RNU2_PLEWA|nr:hypothetical protein NDU88_006910 [Pleurodeles waltl]
MAARWMAVALQVAVLSVVGGGSSPSPAASDGCPLGLLLLVVVLLAVQVAVLAVVQLVVLAAVQVAVLAAVVGGSSPSPAASDGLSAMAGVVCPFLPLAHGGASLLLPAGVPFLPLLAGGASFPLLAGVPFLPLLDGGPFLPLAGGAGTLAVLTGASLEPLIPAVAAETTVAVEWVAEALGWVLAILAPSEGRGEAGGIGQGWQGKAS